MMSPKSECDKQPSMSPQFTQREILDAIRWVESGDDPNPPDGDGGKAIGPYQIHSAYFRDGRDQLKAEGAEVDWLYPEVRDREKAEVIIGAYMRRYCPRSWSLGIAEIIALCHNGGPKWYLKAKKTDAYWTKVKKRLESKKKT